MLPTSVPDRNLAQTMLDILIRAGLIALLAVACYRVFHPFLDLMLWSIILAVTLYPLQRKLGRTLGGKQGRTATILVLFAVVVVLAPIYALGSSLAASVESALALSRGGGLHIPPPADSVATVPLVGKPLHALWLQAATDMSVVTKQFAPQIRAFGIGLLRTLGSFGVSLLLLIVALILAGIFMAFGQSGHRSAIQIGERIFGPGRGGHVAELCTATIRAVAQGVVGIAFIQMLLIGLGFVLLGIPGAGLLSLAVLMLGIVQLPATLLTVPVIIFVFMTRDISVATIVLSIYLFVAGLVDNVLKPLLLGRGVDVPMPVILIGALGGMVTSGVIGLFIGPVMLAVGYELFWEWVRSGSPEVPVEDAGQT